MKTEKKFLALVFLAAGILFSQNNFAWAQDDAHGFSITPFFQEINVSKDQNKAPFSVEVKNNTAASMVFRVSVLDFGALDETGGVAFLGQSDNLKYGLASWISLQNDTLVINPGETQILKGDVENKDSLSPGGHYGAIFLKIEDNEKATDEKQSIALDPSFASLLFVRKTGGEIFGLDLKNKDYSRSIFILPDFVGLRFQNPGNVHVTPRGVVGITDPLGRTIQKGIINEQSGLVLPETFRLFTIKMLNLTKAFIPGRYALAVSYRYDGRDDFTLDNNSFIFIPPIFILSILVLIVFGIFIYFYKKEKFNLFKNGYFKKRKE